MDNENIEVKIEGGVLSENEKNGYIKYLKEEFPNRELMTVNLKVDGEYVDMSYTFADGLPFERIRRITGYLVGTLDRFNDGKRAEERDRVKHDIIGYDTALDSFKA